VGGTGHSKEKNKHERSEEIGLLRGLNGGLLLKIGGPEASGEGNGWFDGVKWAVSFWPRIRMKGGKKIRVPCDKRP